MPAPSPKPSPKPNSLSHALAFQREADKLKAVLRQTRVTFDPERRENDAEHSWHLSLMAIVLLEHAAEPGLDLLRVLRMIVIHDLVEIEAGDTFLYDDAHAASQVEREQKAADRLFGLLEGAIGAELRAAWDEFEARETREARYARALDRAQPMLQNLWTDGASWRAHGITARQVRAKNGPLVRDGAPALWAHLEVMLEDAVQRGVLAEGGESAGADESA
jgi:putative hydrolase of HD superfamily